MSGITTITASLTLAKLNEGKNKHANRYYTMIYSIPSYSNRIFIPINNVEDKNKKSTDM